MESLIELQRQSHEEIERFQRALTDLLAQQPSTHKESISQQHKAAQILDRIQARQLTLNRQYEDHHLRQLELDALSAPAHQDDLSQFYARLVKIKDHHRKYPDSVADGFELELSGIFEAGSTHVDGEEEFEQEDRAFYSISVVSKILRLSSLLYKLCLYYSRAKRLMAAIWIFMPIIPLTTILSTSSED
jgi:splicing factor 3A subunit 3